MTYSHPDYQDYNVHYLLSVMLLSLKILLKLHVKDKIIVCWKESQKYLAALLLETLSPASHGTIASEPQFPVKKSWKQEKVGATFVLQIIPLGDQSTSQIV